MNELLIAIGEAARRLGISRRTYYRWVDQGLLPRPVRIGSKPLVAIADLDRFVQRLREKGGRP